MNTTLNRLGRLYSPDERDKGYLAKMLVPEKLEEKKFKYWNPNFWWGNQGDTPMCVAYSWTHWLAEGPLTQPKARSRYN